MTPDPSQVQQGDQPTGTDTSQTPGDTTPAPETSEAPTPETQEEQAPFKVFQTKEEFERQFGPTRLEGKLSLPKKFGFEHVNKFEEAVEQWKAAHENTLTDQQRVEQENERLKQENQAFRMSSAAQQLAQAAKDGAEKFGIDPTKVDRVMALREKNEGEIDEQGNINSVLLEHSLERFITQNPEFKAPPVTVGNTTGVPVSTGGEALTLQEQITTAQKEGRWQDAIRLESQKILPKLI